MYWHNPGMLQPSSDEYLPLEPLKLGWSQSKLDSHLSA
jgi:hypothetical protein